MKIKDADLLIMILKVNIKLEPLKHDNKQIGETSKGITCSVQKIQLQHRSVADVWHNIIIMQTRRGCSVPATLANK